VVPPYCFNPIARSALSPSSHRREPVNHEGQVSRHYCDYERSREGQANPMPDGWRAIHCPCEYHRALRENPPEPDPSERR
jgi:hypothetical protein